MMILNGLRLYETAEGQCHSPARRPRDRAGRLAVASPTEAAVVDAPPTLVSSSSSHGVLISSKYHSNARHLSTSQGVRQTGREEGGSGH